MARKLNSLFDTPGARAHTAYFLVLVVVCVVPFILLPVVASFLPLRRPAVWAGFALPAVLLFCVGVLYGPVRHRVHRLLGSCDERAVLRSPCLILAGFIEQPGVAEIVTDRLILVPLFGRRIEVPFQDIASVTFSHWFNGALFQSLTGFVVKYSENGEKQFSFAVPDGETWQAMLPRVNR
ncbi:MAG: hypothetical protein R6V12_15385 [Candidatus Hydrogenedentota bacterium]